jgi:hypothetical protein
MRIYKACVLHMRQVDCNYGMLRSSGDKMQINPPETIASNVTVSLGFFTERAERQHRYHAAPSPQYYQKLAEACYIQTGFPCIAAYFTEWLNFLRSNFPIKRSPLD